MRFIYRGGKRLFAVLLAVALVASLLPTAAFAAGAGDTDYSGHWAAPAIDACRTYGIIEGDGDGRFRPDDTITRAEFAAMMNRAFGYTDIGAGAAAPYVDTPSGVWYAPEVSRAAELGLMSGYGNGRFGPDDSITREQAVVILARILRLDSGGEAEPFADESDASAWAREAISAMRGSGYIEGTGENRFAPKSEITRGQTAQMLINVIGVIADGDLDAEGAQFANVTIREPGVRLSNAVITGDLFITEGVGDGDIWLKNVAITGRILAAGGGERSIYTEGVTVGGHIVVDKPLVAGEQPVRFRAIRTNDNTVVIEGAVRDLIIENDIIVIVDAGGDKTVFSLLKNELGASAKPSVMVSAGATVDRITAEVPSVIGGGGTVNRIDANSGEIEIDKALDVKPENVKTGDGIELKTEDGSAIGTGEKKPPSSEGSGGGSITKTPAATPNATFDAATFTLAGTTAQMEYSLDSGATWAACTAPTTDLSATPPDPAHGIRVRDKGNGTTTTRSDVQTIDYVPNEGMDGTQARPFKVYDTETLSHVGKPTTGGEYDGWSLSAHYVQITNITLPEPTEDGESNLVAIGNDDSRFTGTYDGGGKTITGLVIDSADGNQGLFGLVGSGGVVQNVKLIEGSVKGGGSSIGGVVGDNYQGTVENCYYNGSVSSTADGCGGVVGVNEGTVKNCHATGDVTGDLVGGVVGDNYGGIVENCYFEGTVSSTGSDCGGVVGVNRVVSDVVGIVRNCYATGVVTGDTEVGGVVGSNEGTAEHCYATGAVSGFSGIGGVAGVNSGAITGCLALNTRCEAEFDEEETVSRVVGHNYNDGTISDSYAWGGMTVVYNWDSSAETGTEKAPLADDTEDVDGESLTFKTLRGKAAWETAGFTFKADADAVWTWDEDYLPSLLGEETPWPEHLTDPNEGMDGTQANPFKVYDAETLSRVGRSTTGGDYDGWSLSAHYVQIANITLPEPTEEGESNLAAIGNDDSGFTGTYDGGGKTIAGLVINTTEDNQGLFGVIGAGGMVKNVALVNSNIEGRDSIGGVAGVNRGTVESCYNTSSVKSTGTGCGGLVGFNDGTVQNCYTSSYMEGVDNVGGVVGYNSGTVQNCYTTSNMEGADKTGGVVGNNSGTVQSCLSLASYCTVSGSGENAFGRVVGCNDGGTVSSSYGRSDSGSISYETGAGNYTPSSNASGKDGEDITDTQWNSADWWTTLGWSTEVWDFTAVGQYDRLPTLIEAGGNQHPGIGSVS